MPKVRTFGLDFVSCRPRSHPIWNCVKGGIVAFWRSILPNENWRVFLGTNTPPSRRLELKPLPYRPQTTVVTARKLNFLSLWREAPTFSRTWRSSTKSARKTKRLRTRFKRIPRNRRPTEIERDKVSPEGALERCLAGSRALPGIRQASTGVCQPKNWSWTK